MPQWKVERWSGRGSDTHRVAYEGDEETARKKYKKIQVDLRQGSVILINPEGKCVEREYAYLNRTRW